MRDPYNNVGIYAADAPPLKPSDGRRWLPTCRAARILQDHGHSPVCRAGYPADGQGRFRSVVVISRQLAKSFLRTAILWVNGW